MPGLGIFPSKRDIGTSGEFDLDKFSYSSRTFDYSSQTTDRAKGLFINEDLDRIFLLTRSGLNDGGDVWQYNLSTAGEIDSASYSGNTLDVTSQMNVTAGLFFRDDGTEMYIAGYDLDSSVNRSNQRVYKYDLTTPWDLSTASYSSDFLDASTATIQPTGVSASSDGEFFFVAEDHTDQEVRKWSLFPSWDVTTGALDNSDLLDYGGFGVGLPHDIWFKTDGTKLYATDVDNEVVRQHNLSVAWDLSSATDSGLTLDISSEKDPNETLAAMCLAPTGGRLYVASTLDSDTTGAKHIWEYDVT